MNLTEYKELLNNVLIAKVIDVIKHPYADKLNIVVVDMGKKAKTVITGASNMVSNDFVPLMLDGNVVPGYLLRHSEKVVLGKKMLRNLESDAMLLSADELGISDDHTGIYIIEGATDELLGKSILEVLSDEVLAKVVGIHE